MGGDGLGTCGSVAVSCWLGTHGFVAVSCWLGTRGSVAVSCWVGFGRGWAVPGDG
jgi:hypothetical protein